MDPFSYKVLNDVEALYETYKTFQNQELQVLSQLIFQLSLLNFSYEFIQNNDYFKA